MKVTLIIFGALFAILLATFFLHKGSRKWIVLASRLFLGVVFTYSGFVKAVDPLGSTYKFLDYFQAFGLTFFDDLAFPLSILLSSLEFLVGFGLIIGIFLRFYTWVATLFMVVFTPLTLVLAIYNPVSDCGCFGEALILTNWETFWKNIIINIPVLILILKGKKLISPIGKQTSVFINILGISLIVYTSIYSYQHLPMVDFRPYKIGNNIHQGMIIPEGAKTDIYKSTFIYKNLKTGEEKMFSEANLTEPADHPELWEYVDVQSELIQEGYHPPIKDFSISNSDHGDITNQVLEDSMTLLCIAYDLSKTDFESFKKLEQLSLKLKEYDVPVRVVTSALNNQIESLKDTLIYSLGYQNTNTNETSILYYYEKEGQIFEFFDSNLPENIDEYTYIGSEEVSSISIPKLSYQFYICDPITLKTIVRANPGFILLKKGTVIDKWHYNDWKDFEMFKKQYLND